MFAVQRGVETWRETGCAEARPGRGNKVYIITLNRSVNCMFIRAHKTLVTTCVCTRGF